MKVKFIHFMLAAVLVTGSAFSLVSCKDTEGDDYQAMEYKLNESNSLMADRYKALLDQINSLQSDLTSLKDGLAGNTYTDAQIDALIKGLSDRIDEVKQCSCDPTTISNLQTQIDSLSSRITRLEGNSFQSQIDEINKILEYLKGRSATDSTDIATLQSQLSEKYTELVNSINKKADTEWVTTQLDGKADKNWVTDLLNGKADTAQISDLLSQIATLKAQLAAKVDTADYNKNYRYIIEQLEKIQCNCTAVDTTDIHNIKVALNGLQQWQTDHAWLEDIKNIKDELDKYALKTDLNGYAKTSDLDAYAKKSALENAVTKLNNTLDRQKRSLTDQINMVRNTATMARLMAIEADSIAKKAETDASVAQSTAATALANAARAKSVADSLYKLTSGRLDVMETNLTNLKTATIEMLGTLVTQVIVQSTNSPAIGELALPLDIQANMLVTYYGENEDGTFDFPTRSTSHFYITDEADALTAEDVRTTTSTVAGGTLVDQDGNEGNAGTLYVTVNPVDVDATGVDFSLVNSQGKQSVVELSKAAKSDKVLTWGYSRAADGNSLYEVKATITKNNLWASSDIHSNLNRDGLRTAVKNVVDNIHTDATKASIKALARTSAKFIYDNMNTTLPRLGLATDYKVTLGDTAKSLTNVSNFNILAAAFKPAGFGLLDAYDDVVTIPGLERAEYYISRFMNSIKVDKLELPGDARITSVSQITYKDGQATITVNGTNNGKSYAMEVSLDVTSDAVQNLLRSVTTEVNGNDKTVEGAINTFNRNVDSVNNLIAEINDGYDLQPIVDNVTGQITNRIDNYLEQINSRAAYWFNRFKGAIMKPVMLIDGNTNGKAGIHRITPGMTVAAGKYTFVPTTYNYELLTPAYKKYVKIYSGSTVAYNNVFFGDVREIKDVNLESGKTYRVVYEAVDYYGKVAAKTYSIKVK